MVELYFRCIYLLKYLRILIRSYLMVIVKPCTETLNGLMCRSFEMSSKEGKIQMLLIKNLTIKDAGIYTCKIGDRHTEAQLTVNESKPTFAR